MKKLILILSTAILASCSSTSTEPYSVKLYDGPAPGSENWNWPEYKYVDDAGEIYYTNISEPELVVYMPPADKATGAAMVVCPGGSFKINYFTKEGGNVAQWLAEHGVASFVLKYRLIHFADNEEEAFSEVTGNPAPVYTDEEQAALREHSVIARNLLYDDGRAAIAYLRSHASEFGIDPDRIGIMGFSAGGFLAENVALNHTLESRPNLVAPIYGSFGIVPDTLPEDAAPLFVAAPEFDLFQGLTGIELVKAWRATGIPAEAHYFAMEGHGFGYYPEGSERSCPAHVWIDLFYAFMDKIGFLKPNE